MEGLHFLGAGAASLTETVKAVPASGEALTVDLVQGTEWDITLTKNCTITFPAPTKGRSFSLVLRQDGTGGRTVTWPASTRWSGGVYPLLSTAKEAVDLISFTCIDGEHWLGFFDGAGMASGGAELAAGPYRQIMYGGVQIGAAVAAGTYALLPGAGGNVALTATTAHALRWLDPAKFLIAQRTTRYRVQVMAAVNNTAPGVNFTVELRKVTETAGGAAALTIAASAQVAGLTAAINKPEAKKPVVAESEDIEAPVAGAYILAVTTTEATAAASMTDLLAGVYVR